MTGMLFGVALAGAPAWPDLSQSPRTGGGQNDAAVIVAVEDYAVVIDIPGAQANGVDWYTYFTDGRGIPASRVKLLVNNEGVRESIHDAVAQARDAVRPGGTLWFVFVGHGAPGKDGADGLLVGWDTQQTASSLYARGVSQSELIASLSGGAQAETVLVLDACFSGQGSGAGATLIAGLQPMIPTSAPAASQATVLSAGQSNEFAGPLPGLERPAFSYLVLGALRGWGDADGDGQVSAQEATDYSTGALAALPIGRSQTPQLTAPAPALALGTAHEEGPSLAEIRKSLLDTPTTASAPAGTTAGETGLRTDGYYRCQPPAYGGASSQLIAFVASDEMHGMTFISLSVNGMDRKYPNLRSKVDAQRGSTLIVPQDDGTLLYREIGVAELHIQQALPDRIDVSWVWLGMNKVHGGEPVPLSCPFVQP